jgi:aspartate kinase
VHDGFKLHEESVVAPPVGWETKPVAQLSHRSRDELERDVVSRLSHMEDIVVSEVLLDQDQSRVTVRNLPDEPGVAAKIFTAVAEGGVMVDMIVQNISQRGHANLSFTVLRKDLDQCLLLVREVLEPWRDAALSFERDIAKLSVMGIGLRSHTGVGEKMFRALAEAGVNIQMVSTSEIRISAVVSPADGQRALDTLLKTFDL